MASPRSTALRPVARRSVRGALSIIEMSLIAGVVGTALAIFLPTFFREMHTSKIAEATQMLDQISQRVASYYSNAQESAGGARRCLPDPAGPTPEAPSPDPRVVDFYAPPPLQATPGEEEPPPLSHPTWIALAVESERPLRYSYSFEPSESGCNVSPDEEEPLFVLRAIGDLDGDEDFSTFEQGYRVALGKAEPFGDLQVLSRVE